MNSEKRARWYRAQHEENSLSINAVRQLEADSLTELKQQSRFENTSFVRFRQIGKMCGKCFSRLFLFGRTLPVRLFGVKNGSGQ